VAFPLGGIGGGNVMLRGDGTLQKWTVLNCPRKEAQPLDCMPANFFGISATPQGQAQQAFVLASPETYSAATVHAPTKGGAKVSMSSVRRLQSIPGIQSLQITGKYPIADVDYTINGFPLDVSMEAMTPLLPGQIQESGLPGAYFTFKLQNSGSTPVTARILQSQQNFVGWDGQTDATQPPVAGWGGNVNTPFAADGQAGLKMSSSTVASDNIYSGTISAAALTGLASGSVSTASVIPQAATEEELWQAFVTKSDVDPANAPATAPSAASLSYCGGVVQTVTIAPSASVSVTFALAWHFPDRDRVRSCGTAYAGILPDMLGNLYSTWYAS
jgi:non-lysosomal glucosylceramidase